MRYGQWDGAIELFELGKEPKGEFDVICLGTPPDVRIELARKCLKEKPKVLQLEKPMAAPLMNYRTNKEMKDFLKEVRKSEVRVVVGYEYALSTGIQKVGDFIKDNDLGEVETLEVSIRENWKGIFSAHPWLAGPHETYLGFWQKGGGACGEHSHAIHLWQHFSNLLGLGEVVEVSAAMKIVKDGLVEYDAISFINIQTEKGFLGHIIQDVVTEPPLISIRIQRKKGFAEWFRYAGPTEKVKLAKKVEERWEISEEEIKLKRPDDFYHEISHIKDLVDGSADALASPISFKSGLEALKVITAAHRSRLEGGRFVKI
jgi:predicted dehydrogenase